MTKFKLPKRFRSLWLKDLESKKFNQTTSYLMASASCGTQLADNENVAFCCLGVAATQFYERKELYLKTTICSLGFEDDFSDYLQATKNTDELPAVENTLKELFFVDEHPDIEKFILKYSINQDYIKHHVVTFEDVFTVMNDKYNFDFIQIAEFIKKFTKGV